MKSAQQWRNGLITTLLISCLSLLPAACQKQATSTAAPFESSTLPGQTTTAQTSLQTTAAPPPVTSTASTTTAATLPPATETAAPTASPTTAARTVEDYFPLTANVFFRYSGTGNEYVPMTVCVEYVRPGQIQLAYDNGGTQVHVLYAVGNGKVQKQKTVLELYVREDLAQLPPDRDGEILLKEPLSVGTSWQTDGQTRTITAVDVPVTTAAGTFSAIEVTTTGPDEVMRQYYARGIGLVKMTAQNGYEISQELAERTLNAAHSQTLTLFYPRMTQTDIELAAHEVTVQMRTNEGIREILDRYFRSPAQAFPTRTYTVKPHDTLWSIALYNLGDGQKYRDLAALNGLPPPYTLYPGQILVLESATDLPALISPRTTVQQVHLQPDREVVAIDLSSSFVTDMNAGSGFEAALIQSIVNTVGRAYGVSKVVITLDGRLYESGHIALRPGETFTVDLSKVVQLP